MVKIDPSVAALTPTEVHVASDADDGVCAVVLEREECGDSVVLLVDPANLSATVAAISGVSDAERRPRDAYPERLGGSVRVSGTAATPGTPIVIAYDVSRYLAGRASRWSGVVRVNTAEER